MGDWDVNDGYHDLRANIRQIKSHDISMIEPISLTCSQSSYFSDLSNDFMSSNIRSSASIHPIGFKVRQPWWSTTKTAQNININWNAKINPKPNSVQIHIMHFGCLIWRACACSSFSITHTTLCNLCLRLQVSGDVNTNDILNYYYVCLKLVEIKCAFKPTKTRRWWSIKDHYHYHPHWFSEFHTNVIHLCDSKLCAWKYHVKSGAIAGDD